MKNTPQPLLQLEFERQVSNLLQKGYPKAAGLSVQAFLKLVEPFKKKLARRALPSIDLEKGHLPFVIVISSDLVTPETAMALTEKDGRKGVTILRPHTSKHFRTVEDADVPKSKAYLLLDIDRGKKNINQPPNQAMRGIRRRKRLPLTIDEGIAIVTHFPEFLMKNNCFSLLASRTGKDQRVPAIWINGKKEPNLGWCWDGNPHTWLGSASAARRIT